MIDMTQELASALKASAESAYPEEACGYITAKGVYVPCENMADAPDKDFCMDTSAWLTGDVAAIFHSHPDAADAPSAADMQQQVTSAVPWALCAVNSDGSATDPYFWGSFDYVPPLVGRDFRHGPSGSDNRGDCYALIRDYYYLERKIVLPEFPRSDGWWKEQNFDLYSDHFQDAGFHALRRSRETYLCHAFCQRRLTTPAFCFLED